MHYDSFGPDGDVKEAVIEALKLPGDPYDWSNAFDYAASASLVMPENDGERVPTDGFAPIDVDEVYGAAEGEHDGDAWVVAGRLQDGRQFFLSAGCDYTGWDCQAGGEALVTKTKAYLVRYGIPREERERMGLALEGE